METSATCSAEQQGVKRASESIADLLGSMYPSHPSLKGCLDALEEAGYSKLDELGKVTCTRIGRYIPHIFIIALRDYLVIDGSDTVSSEVTTYMDLSYISSQTVTLRPENIFPQLPNKFNPVLEKDEKDVNVAAEDRKEDTDQDYDVSAEDEKEQSIQEQDIANALGSVDEAPTPEYLTLQMYVCSWKGRGRSPLQTLWCSDSKNILVRKSYKDLLVVVKNLWECGNDAVLLLGVPGIGKSAFLIVMLLFLMGKNVPIVFQTKGGELYYYEPHAGVGYRCYRLRSSEILLDSEVYYLVDGKLANLPTFACKALLGATPKLANYQDYDKSSYSYQVYLPVWSAAEIALAWQEIFDPSLPQYAALRLMNDEKKKERDVARLSLTLDVTKERYRKWGGTARYVLAKPHVDLDRIVSGLQSIQATVEAVGKQIADGEHPSHKLVHQRIALGYDSYEYMFASPHLVEVATRKLKDSTAGALRLFLSFKGLEAHGVNGCKGYVLQHEFKDITSRGTTMKFRVRLVHEDLKQASQDEEKAFDFGQLYQIDKLAQLPSPPPVNRIIWPDSPVEETIDAMMLVRQSGKPDILELYQVTLSSARHMHGLKYTAILALMQKFNIRAENVRIYIVTSSERYPDAGYQNLRTKGKLVLKSKRLLALLQGITQYVLDSGI